MVVEVIHHLTHERRVWARIVAPCIPSRLAYSQDVATVCSEVCYLQILLRCLEQGASGLLSILLLTLQKFRGTALVTGDLVEALLATQNLVRRLDERVLALVGMRCMGESAGTLLIVHFVGWVGAGAGLRFLKHIDCAGFVLLLVRPSAHALPYLAIDGELVRLINLWSIQLICIKKGWSVINRWPDIHEDIIWFSTTKASKERLPECLVFFHGHVDSKWRVLVHRGGLVEVTSTCWVCC